MPGQVFYDASRKLILKGVDGVIFVADSQMERLEANRSQIVALRQQLSKRENELAEMLSKFKPEHPQVAKMEALISSLKARIAALEAQATSVEKGRSRNGTAESDVAQKRAADLEAAYARLADQQARLALEGRRVQSDRSRKSKEVEVLKAQLDELKAEVEALRRQQHTPPGTSK